MNFIKDILKTILYKPLFNLMILIVWLIPGNNVGWAIIILTALVRLALYPSQKKSIESQKKMQDIQPKIEELKKKYPNDQQAQAQEMMQLYKTYKVNPFSSCLPLLIQLPILIVLYRVFTAGLTTDRFDELLYHFTPRPEVINPYFFGLNLSDPSIYLAILAGVLQLIQSRQMMKAQPAKSKKSSGPAGIMGDFSTQMVYIFPIFTVIIAMSLPSALALYWIVTTLFMIIQQKMVFSKKQKIDPRGVSVNVRKNR
jgi:YidC/Oxa1 family membrane protein insertase